MHRGDPVPVAWHSALFPPKQKRERRGFPHRSRKEGGVGYLVYFVGREVSMVILLPSAAVMPLSLVTAAVMIA